MSKKSKLKRVPKRGIYDRNEVYKILDNNLICHIAFVHNNVPVSIPTMYGREKDTIYIHGAMVSRMLGEIEKGINICLSVAKVNALILARSAFHHSLNYESVVVFGKGTLVEGAEKIKALKIISDQMIQERWEEVRFPNEKELHATKVIAISIDEITGKIRDEGVNDAKKDLKLPIWSGIVPIKQIYESPINAEFLSDNLPVSDSVKKLISKNN